jgi:hypothetical protein
MKSHSIEQQRATETTFIGKPSEVMTAAPTLEHPQSRTGLWVAILTALMAVVSLTMAITTLPRSGPYCQTAVLAIRTPTSRRSYRGTTCGWIQRWSSHCWP